VKDHPQALQAQRRTLHYATLDELLRDAEQLASNGHRTTGKWTYGQILEHLAMGSDCFFDGFGFMAPWWARWFIAPLVRGQFLNKTMRAGFQLPKQAERLLPQGDVAVEPALDHLRRSLARFQAETPAAPHPFLGRLRSKDEYIALQLRHSELHMSYVHPV
jgi:hypothetical protein